MWENNKKLNTIVSIAVLVALVASAVFLAVAYRMNLKQADGLIDNELAVTDQDSVGESDGANTVEEASQLESVELPKDLLANLKWHYPESVEGLNFFAPSFSVSEWFGGGPESYDIGEFSYQDKAGKIIYVSLGAYPGSAEMNFKAVNYDGSYVILKGESTNASEFEIFGTDFFAQLNGDVVKIDEKLKFPASATIKAPDLLTTGEKGQIAKFIQTDSLTQFYPDRTSADGTVKYQDSKHGVFYDFNDYNGNFSYILPDGEIARYRLQNDMLNNIAVSDIAWNDKRTGDGEYSALASSCGGTYLNMVKKSLFNSSVSVELKSDLVITGKNKAGENIYEFKDANHPYLKSIYDFTYYPNDAGEKISYAEFIAMHPLFIWVDPFGRMIDFRLNKLQPVAECGKPVIYLYPEKETKVSVKLDLSKWSYSEPEYGNGWEVIAEPTGKLTEVNSGKVYPYLFWEGIGVGEVSPQERGFVIKKEEVHNFLVEKLNKLGLNDQESADFREFWEPKMQSAPYYFVTFYGTSAMNTIAPLHINPQPDTVIRILMDYKPLEQPIEVKPLMLGSLKRKGFTVVEWGGVLRK